MIKKLMAQVKLTQADMAKVVGLSRSAMGRVLNGGEYPNGFDHIVAANKMVDALVSKGLDKDLVVRALEGDQQCSNTVDPSFSNMKKAIDMLLRKQALTQETKKHFGIFRDPFAEIGESDEVFAASQDIRYVRESLYSAVKHGGFMAVVGESGAGKSTLRRDLIERIRKENLPAVVIEPYVLGMEDNDVKGKTLKALSIAEAIISAVSPLTPIKRSSEGRFRQLHQVLRDSRKAGNVHVLVIEEAHGLSIPTLKHLKRFYELEDGFKRLLSIVLIGQPELKLKLAEQNFEVREVVQRCEVVNLRPMDDVLPDYLAFKFKRAGKELNEVISDDGIEALRAALTLQGRGQRANVSLLYPLAIGNLMMAAMNVAAELKAPKVTADIVKLTQAGGV